MIIKLDKGKERRLFFFTGKHPSIQTGSSLLIGMGLNLHSKPQLQLKHSKFNSHILSTDRPKIRSWFQNVNSWINHATKLTCQAEGVPLPDISWSRSGTTNQKAINHTHVVSDLLVIPRNANDFGTYTCTATNILGSHKQSISLVQLSKFPDNSLDFCESLNCVNCKKIIAGVITSFLQPRTSTLFHQSWHEAIVF